MAKAPRLARALENPREVEGKLDNLYKYRADRPKADTVHVVYIPDTETYPISVKQPPMLYDCPITSVTNIHYALKVIEKLIQAYCVYPESEEAKIYDSSSAIIERFRKIMDLIQPLLQELKPIYMEESDEEAAERRAQENFLRFLASRGFGVREQEGTED